MTQLRTALLDIRQMDEADRLTIIAGTSAITLMENTGKAVAHPIAQRWKARAVTVLCGPGNNDGDGFVVACQFAASEWPVRVSLIGSSGMLIGPESGTDFGLLTQGMQPFLAAAVAGGGTVPPPPILDLASSPLVQSCGDSNYACVG